jgi:hypothetical protein
MHWSTSSPNLEGVERRPVPIGDLDSAQLEALQRALRNYGRLAELDGAWGPLDRRLIPLFRVIVSAAAGTLQQLLVANVHADLEWGLHRVRDRVTLECLTTMIYWFTLFYIARFTEWGLDGYSRAALAPELRNAAKRWVSYISSGVGMQTPQPWHPDWLSQDVLEASRNLVDAVCELLQVTASRQERGAQARAFATNAVPDMYDALRTRMAELNTA